MQLETLILSEASQKEKDRYHRMSLICGTQNRAQVNLCTKQKETHRDTLVVTKGRAGRREGVALGGWKMQTATCRMDEQGPTVEHRELYSTSCDKP